MWLLEGPHVIPLAFKQAVDVLLEGNCERLLSQAWWNWSSGQHEDPVLAAVEGGHIDILRRLLKHQSGLSIEYLEQAESSDR